jgi:cytidylate kinase
MLITISRQYGSGGSAIAQRVAEALDWRLVDNELVEQVARRAGLSADEVAEREERAPSFIERLARVLAAATPELFPPPAGTVLEQSERDLVRITETVVADIASEGNVVLVGRAAPVLLDRAEGALHVKVVASSAFRIRATAARFGLDPKDAERIVRETDANRERYHRDYYNREWDDPLNYHMTLNTERLGVEGAADIVVAEAKRRRADGTK